jgi:HEAT repeat protein
VIRISMTPLPAGAILSVALLAVAGCAARDETPMLAGGREVQSWLTALHDPDPKVRRQALLKLGNVGDADPDVEQGLAGALRDVDAQVRRDAVFAVVKLQQPGEEIIGQLAAMSREDNEPDIRDVALRALAKLERSQ